MCVFKENVSESVPCLLSKCTYAQFMRTFRCFASFKRSGLFPLDPWSVYVAASSSSLFCAITAHIRPLLHLIYIHYCADPNNPVGLKSTQPSHRANGRKCNFHVEGEIFKCSSGTAPYVRTYIHADHLAIMRLAAY